MKAILQILFLQLIASSLIGQQFYLRGEVRDEAGNLLQNVTIHQKSTGYVFYSGNSGSFGIPAQKKSDSLIFIFDGYQKEQVTVNADKFASIHLKLLPSMASNIKRGKLSSLTVNLEKDEQKKWYTGDETYASLVENHFIETEKFPAIGVALNIDRAAYSNIRRFINLGMAVPTDAVRIEEMLNNFNFGYQPPTGNSTFNIKSTLTTCPWNEDHQLFFVNLFSKKLNLDSLPPSHLVFLIDISGSMDMPNRLPLLKSSFHMLAMNLREKDTVSIVIYGGAVGVMLFPTSGKEKVKICKAIDELEPGGSTPGESGIKLAYSIAKKHFIEGGNNRIILATDGDFNVGLKTEQELDELVSSNRKAGIYLTCLGVGMGNYKDSKIQMLATKGNGNFAYLDNYQEAEKVLMKEFTQTLYTVAENVFMNVKFDPRIVKQYRLIGFDNKVDALADSLSVIEGGEIGSGQTLIIAFELEPASKSDNNNSASDFAQVNLHYKLPFDTTGYELNEKFGYDPVPLNEVDQLYQFATSVIMFGSLLKHSGFTKNISWGDVLYHASESANPTDINQSQFTELVYKAKAFYSRSKKNKRKNSGE